MKSAIRAVLRSLNLELRRLGSSSDSQFAVPSEADSEDIRIFNYVRDRGLTMVSPARLWSTILACHYVCKSQVPGDFVECGVWRGGNAIAAANVFQRYGQDRKVYLFDTFEGMSLPSALDVNLMTGETAVDEYKSRMDESHDGWCLASLDEVISNFKDAQVPMDLVHLIKGKVEDTLNERSSLPETVSILRLDTDWYESTRHELVCFFPRLSVGGVLIVDDYGYWAGSKKATDEYLSTAHGGSFLVPVDDSRLMLKMKD